MTKHEDSEINRFDRLDVEGFVLYDGKSATRYFERDHDLEVKVRKALGGRGDQRAVVLVTLGIDEYDCHLVQANFGAGHYDEGSFAVVSEAIDALEVIRQQLGVMKSTPGVRFSEHNAFSLGVEAGRAGGVERVHDGE